MSEGTRPVCFHRQYMMDYKNGIAETVYMTFERPDAIDQRNTLHIPIGDIALCFRYTKSDYSDYSAAPGLDTDALPEWNDICSNIEPCDFLITWDDLNRWEVTPKQIFFDLFNNLYHSPNKVLKGTECDNDKLFSVRASGKEGISVILFTDPRTHRAYGFEGDYFVKPETNEKMYFAKDDGSNPLGYGFPDPIRQMQLQGRELTDSLYQYKDGWLYPYDRECVEYEETPLTNCFRRIREKCENYLIHNENNSNRHDEFSMDEEEHYDYHFDYEREDLWDNEFDQEEDLFENVLFTDDYENIVSDQGCENCPFRERCYPAGISSQ